MAPTACASDICTASCKDNNPPDTTTPAPGGWACGTPNPTAIAFGCNRGPGITAIPPGLLNDARQLTRLYGRPRDPPWAANLHMHLVSIARHPQQPCRPYDPPPHALIDFNCLHTLPRWQPHAAVDPVCTTYAPSASPPAAAAVAWFCHPPPVCALQGVVQQRHHGDT